MADLDLSVVLSRDNLDLTPLEINDFLNYYVGAQFLGGSMAYQRTTLTSPFTDGGFTAQRFRQQVSEQIAVEVMGGTHVELTANIKTLIEAFEQDSFTVTVTIGSQTILLDAEAADHQMVWTGPRWVQNQGQVVFTMPRAPQPRQGVA